MQSCFKRNGLNIVLTAGATAQIYDDMWPAATRRCTGGNKTGQLHITQQGMFENQLSTAEEALEDKQVKYYICIANSKALLHLQMYMPVVLAEIFKIKNLC